MTMLKAFVHIGFWTAFLYAFGLVLPADGWAMVIWFGAIIFYASRVLSVFGKN